MKSPSAADFLSVESVILFFIGCLVVNILITANVLPNYMLLFSQGRSNMYLGTDYLPAQKTDFFYFAVFASEGHIMPLIS